MAAPAAARFSARVATVRVSWRESGVRAAAMMPREPPPTGDLITAALTAGLGELAKPSANLGLRHELAAFARILDPGLHRQP